MGEVDILSRCPIWAAGGNWLLTSASSKVDLVRRFRGALNEYELKLIATDISPYSPALYAADDAFLTRPDSAEDFIGHLVNQCHRFNVRVILPTRDAEIPVLLSFRKQLYEHKIWVISPPTSSVLSCQDKLKFHDWCRIHHLPVLPALVPALEEHLPVFARPRFDAGGRDARIIESHSALEHFYATVNHPEWLIQRYCALPEYTIDALFDFDGRPAQWVARERIRVEAGESKVSRTIQHPMLDKLVLDLAAHMGLVGPVTIQAFCGDDAGPWLIEVNARMGGASALGIEAGLDSPRRLVALIQGDYEAFARPRSIEYGLTMLRHSADLFFRDSDLLDTEG